MSQFKSSVKAILEANERGMYDALVREINRNRAAGLRLEAIINRAVLAGANMVKNSVSLNRLNTLAIALADCKQNSQLSKLARVPEYLQLQHVISWSKTEKCFSVVNYASLKTLAQDMTLPSVKFSDWLKANRKKAESETLTVDKAQQRIRALYSAMRQSPAVLADERFAGIIPALEEYIEAHDRDFSAALERERVRELLGK